MGIVDIILLLCFIPGIVRGISKGFVHQIISLASIFIGAWLAVKFSALVSNWLTNYMQLDPKVLKIISFAIIVLLAILLLYWLGELITNAFKATDMGWLNRLLGLVFSIVKVALILGLLIMLFDGLNDKIHLFKPEVFDDAVLYNALKDFGQSILPFLKSFISGGAAPIEA